MFPMHWPRMDLASVARGPACEEASTSERRPSCPLQTLSCDGRAPGSSIKHLDHASFSSRTSAQCIKKAFVQVAGHFGAARAQETAAWVAAVMAACSPPLRGGGWI